MQAGKGLPEVQWVLKLFKIAFDWVEANGTGCKIPREEIDLEYDSALEMLMLRKYLKMCCNL